MPSFPLKTASILLLFLAGAFFMQPRAMAEEPWHRCVLQPYVGYVNNAATIDAHDTYQKLKLGGEAEPGLGFSAVVNRCTDFELALAYLKSSGTQYNSPGSGNENTHLNIDLKQIKMFLTGKMRYNQHEGMAVPWAGAGLNVTRIAMDYNETVETSGGQVDLPGQSKISMAVGGHVLAGVDLYPVKTSSLALSIAARYQWSPIVSGPFDGSLDSWALLFGIKWDFWATTESRAEASDFPQ